MIEKHGVELKLNTKFESADASGFDEVIVATGIIPRKLSIEGIDHEKVVSYLDVLQNKITIGEKVAIIGAGGIGFDVAEYLTHQGESTALNSSAFMKEWGVDQNLDARGGVEGVESQVIKSSRKVFLLQRKKSKVGAGLGKTTGWAHRFSLRSKNVKMINGVTYSKIDDTGLHYVKNEKKIILDVDHIVICAGQLSNSSLHKQLISNEVKAHLIGGAFKAAEIDAKEAINQAVKLAAVI